MKRSVLYLLAIACASTASAQDLRRAEPKDALAPVPPATYRSAFEGYAGFRDEEPLDWRKLNDEVAKAGGHLGIFRGAGRAGHGMHKPPAKPAAKEDRR